jgi:Tol biopolymer transport system component
MAVAALILLRACGGKGCHDSGVNPTLSPDGKQLVFEYLPSGPPGCGDDQKWGLWLANVDGTDRRKLARRVPADASRPKWSPDGKRIAFYGAGPDDKSSVFVMAVNGRRLRRIAVADGGDYGLSWSPDGREIAYVDGEPLRSKNDTLRLVAVDGGRTETLGPVGAHVTGTLVGPTPTRVALPVNPAWSPDGRWIAVEANGGVDLIGVNDRRRKRLVSNGSYPAWSRDSRDILFVEDRTSPNSITARFRLVLIHPDGSGRRTFAGDAEIHRASADPLNVEWSRDGSLIAFWSCCPEIYTIRPDGTHLRRIT